MAIFRNKIDRGLPLLGQLYQLDPTSEAEITDFLALFAAEEGTPAHAFAWEAARFMRDPSDYRDLTIRSGVEKDAARVVQERREEIVSVVGEIVGLVRVVLDGLARHHTLPVSALREVERAGSTSLAFYRTVGEEIAGGYMVEPVKDDEPPIPLTELYPSDDTPNLYPSELWELRHLACRQLYLLIDRAVAAASHEDLHGGLLFPVGICEECDSVYVNSTRARRLRFCSYRCANRRGARERMRALKM